MEAMGTAEIPMLLDVPNLHNDFASTFVSERSGLPDLTTHKGKHINGIQKVDFFENYFVQFCPDI
jgi:hypothetical protein